MMRVDETFDDVFRILEEDFFEPGGAEGHPALRVSVDEKTIMVYGVVYIVESLYNIVC